MSTTAARTAERRADRPVVLATLGVAVLAWVALILLPFGVTGHRHGSAVAQAGDMAAMDAMSTRPGPALFLVGWMLMVAAMMLPASLRFVTTVHRLVASRAHRRTLLGVAVTGYALPWLLVGHLGWLAAVGADELSMRSGWLGAHPWLVAAAVLAVAGGYQFTPVALRCLQQCRDPAGFVVRGWHGLAPRRDLLRIGVAYGWSCVGCCWALMALMVVSATSGLLVMAALTVVMVLERNVRGIGPAVGGLLLAGALLLTVVQVG